MKKVLVTGGAGFIGSNLVDVLLEKKVEVVIIDNLSTGNKNNINNNATFLEYDLSSMSAPDLIDVLSDIDIVFHLAALARVQPSIENPLPYNNANVNDADNNKWTILHAASQGGMLTLSKK